MDKKFQTLRAGLAAVLVFSLTACGGGSSTSSIDSAQGIWESTTSGAAQSSAVVLPDGTAWVVIQDTGGSRTRLLKFGLSVSGQNFAGPGNSYAWLSSSSDQTKATANLSATVTSKATVTGTVTTTGSSNDSLTMSYVSRYDTAAVLADYQGSWTGSAGAGTVTYSMNISSTGVISGSSSTGCTYTGQLATRTEAKAIVTLSSMVEDCSGTQKTFSGIGVLNALKTGASLAGVTSDGSVALLLRLTRSAI